MQDWMIGAAVGGVGVLYGISLYNRLINLRHSVDQAWSNIDVLLKQRYEQIPALVELCKRYMAHESEVLAEITRLRNQADSARASGDAAALGGRETALGAALTTLVARVEAYPELKAADQFAQLSAQLTQLYEAISDRRELYNEAVTLNNQRREQFPESLMAGLCGVTPRALIQIEEAERANPDMKSLLSA